MSSKPNASIVSKPNIDLTDPLYEEVVDHVDQERAAKKPKLASDQGLPENLHTYKPLGVEGIMSSYDHPKDVTFVPGGGYSCWYKYMRNVDPQANPQPKNITAIKKRSTMIKSWSELRKCKSVKEDLDLINLDVD
ncbi:hypothetical protein ACFE04_012250 [Oxalis oulophora]